MRAGFGVYSSMSEFIHSLVDGRLLNDWTALLVVIAALLFWTVFLLCVAFRENRLQDEHRLHHREMWRNHWGAD